MANNLSTLGLSCASLSFTSTAGQSVLNGAVNCVLLASQPDGMLLRRVQSLNEAISLGGLFLYDSTDAGKWWFACGHTLLDAIRRKVIGKVESMSQDGKNYLLVRRQRDFSHQSFVDYGSPSGERITLGGDLHTVHGYEDMFEGRDVIALGVVTGATEGRGRSYAPNGWSPFSYLATLVPMNVTFEQFITKKEVYEKAIELVPNDLKGFYVDTFASTLATFAQKTAKPSIAVTTFWRGTEEVGLPKSVDVAWTTLPGGICPSADGASSPDILDPSIVYGSNITSGYNGTVGTRELGWRLEGTQFLGSPVGGLTSAKFTNKSRVGYPQMRQSGWVGPVLLGDASRLSYGEKQVGEIEGMKVGYFRDFHVMKRALVDGQRYAEDSSSFTSLAAMVNSTFGEPLDTSRVPSVGTVEQLENLLSDFATADIGQHRIMQQRGSLPDTIEKFNDNWDQAAMTRAKG